MRVKQLFSRVDPGALQRGAKNRSTVPFHACRKRRLRGLGMGLATPSYKKLPTATKTATKSMKSLPSEEEEGPFTCVMMKRDGESRKDAFSQPGRLPELAPGMSAPCLNLASQNKSQRK